MQDRYLSKAKRKDNGEWVQGVPFEIEGKTVILINDTENLLRTHYLEENMWTSEIYAIEVDPSTICRCTGLKDKHGNLIWENDIVCHAYTKYQKENTDYPPFCRVEKRKNYVIKWDNTMVHLGFRYHNGRNIFPFKNGTVINGDDEVIGNVFDNPELLESEEAGR